MQANLIPIDWRKEMGKYGECSMDKGITTEGYQLNTCLLPQPALKQTCDFTCVPQGMPWQETFTVFVIYKLQAHNLGAPKRRMDPINISVAHVFLLHVSYARTEEGFW